MRKGAWMDICKAVKRCFPVWVVSVSSSSSWAAGVAQLRVLPKTCRIQFSFFDTPSFTPGTAAGPPLVASPLATLDSAQSVLRFLLSLLMKAAEASGP